MIKRYHLRGGPGTFPLNIYFLGLFILLSALAIYVWNFGTKISLGHDDLSYHLAVAEGFVRAKSVVTWDFWESLPLGRPHNYPPLIHIIMAFFIRAGFSSLSSVKLILELVLVGGLSLFSFGVNKLFGIKTAFWSVFFIILWSSFLRMSATVLPSTLVLFSAPALLYFALNKKWITLGALLVLVFYTHLFMPYFVALSLILYLIFFARGLVVPTLITIFCAFLLYAPWLIHVFSAGLSYIKYFDSSSTFKVDDTFIRINLLPFILFIFGAAALLFETRKKYYRPAFFFCFLLLVLLPISIVSTNRTFNGHCLIAASVISALGLSLLPKKRYLKYFGVIIFSFYTLMIPYLNLSSSHMGIKFNSTFVNDLAKSHFGKQLLSEEKYAPAFQAIVSNSSPGDSVAGAVWGLDNVFYRERSQITAALFFAANSGRPVLNLRQPELYRREEPDLKRAKIIVLSVSREELSKDYLKNIGRKNEDISILDQDFDLVSDPVWSDENSIYIYRNNSPDIIKETLPSFRFPLWLADLLILTLIFLAVAGSFGPINFKKFKFFKKHPW